MAQSRLELTDRALLKASTFMGFANGLSALSTCKRKGCGALLTPRDFTRVVAVGYNGPSRLESNDACPGTEGCGCLHAEVNCLTKPRYPTDVDLLLLVTRAPCLHCAKVVCNSGAVTGVVYVYESTLGVEGLEFLNRVGIPTLNLSKEF
jgi:deoxycytidylate deaminase